MGGLSEAPDDYDLPPSLLGDAIVEPSSDANARGVMK